MRRIEVLETTTGPGSLGTIFAENTLPSGSQTWLARKSIVEFHDFPIKTSFYSGFSMDFPSLQ
jgi:hypothetical protein